MDKKIYNRCTAFSAIPTRIILGLLMMSSLGACKKYLDVKPDKTLVLPSTMADCQALLDNVLVMNAGFPSTEPAADNYYLLIASWNNLPTMQRDSYIWSPMADMNQASWLATYQKALYANQVLVTLGKITPASPADQATWNQIRGEALFFRGFSYYIASQLWAQPYIPATAATDLGIPLHLTPDISEKTFRATVQQTYDRVTQDLKEAITLLPVTLPTSIIGKTRPSVAAAYAVLARMYMAMGDYVNAGVNADASLKLYGTLMDYNNSTYINAAATYPITRFCPETIFYAQSTTSQSLVASVAKVDSNLYASYLVNDRRRIIFFKTNTGANAGTRLFCGSYDGSNSNGQFSGPTTDEMYLTRAECFARAGNTAAALADLNTLLRTRWVTGTYTDMTAIDADDALAKILVERRKELLFRGIRWTDLRRLNLDSRFAITLTRVLSGVTYTLPPKDPRYTLLIPSEVIRREPMLQNPR